MIIGQRSHVAVISKLMSPRQRVKKNVTYSLRKGTHPVPIDGFIHVNVHQSHLQAVCKCHYLLIYLEIWLHVELLHQGYPALCGTRTLALFQQLSLRQSARQRRAPVCLQYSILEEDLRQNLQLQQHLLKLAK